MTPIIAEAIAVLRDSIHHPIVVLTENKIATMHVHANPKMKWSSDFRRS